MGYESTVAAVLIIAGAILWSVLVYTGTPPTFVAYARVRAYAAGDH